MLTIEVWQDGRVVATRLLTSTALTTTDQTFPLTLTDGDLMLLEDVDAFPVEVVLTWEASGGATGVVVDAASLSVEAVDGGVVLNPNIGLLQSSFFAVF